MIARELLDRGIARRLGVLCPAHLCDQWERELRQKFAIDAAVVQPVEHRPPGARAAAPGPLDLRALPAPHREHRLRQGGPPPRPVPAYAPDLVIVDEAHGAARPPGDRERGQHQRHELIHALAAAIETGT